MNTAGCREIHQFVQAFCDCEKIENKQIQDGVFRLELNNQIFTYTERPELIGVADAEYLTYGHPLLDCLLNVARSHGWTANLIHPLSTDDYDSLQQVLRSLPVRGGNVELLSTSLLYHSRLLYTFKVSLLADVRRDELVTVLADPETDKVEIGELPPGLCSIPEGFRPLPDRRRYPKALVRCETVLHNHLTSLAWLRETDYRVFHLYQNSCLFLHNWLLQKYASFEQEQLLRYQSEKEVVDDYYDSLLTEEMARLYDLLHKAAVLQVRINLAKSVDTRAGFNREFQACQEQIGKEKERCKQYGQKLAVEKGKRLHELANKYLPKAFVSLVSAARLYTPRAVVLLRNPSKPSSEPIRLVYDFVAKEWLDLRCECCGEIAHMGLYMSSAGLFCGHCAEKCELCGQYTELPAVVCESCGRKICSDCLANCLLAQRNEPGCVLCKCCEGEICKTCNNLLQIKEMPP